jgi:hypothetical protein
MTDQPTPDTLIGLPIPADIEPDDAALNPAVSPAPWPDNAVPGDQQ